MQQPVPSPERRRPWGVRALTLFFGLGAAISLASLVALATPGGPLEPMWKLNPRARTQFAAMGPWSLVLMAVVCAACVLTVVGLLRLSRWGWLLAIAMLATSLVGDLANAVLGLEPRAWVGVPIAALLLGYLASREVRGAFAIRKPR